MRLLSLFLFCVILLPEARTQTMEGGIATTLPSASAASYYYVAKPGELTMQINIWGDVLKPGRYEVASSTNLIQLVSYAGGPTREANLHDVRITRFLTTEGGVRKQQFVVNLEDFSKTDEASMMLRSGDAVFVDYVTRLNVRDAFVIITTAALVTAAVAQVIYSTNR